MDSSFSAKDKIWFSARVPSHFNWPVPSELWHSAPSEAVLKRRIALDNLPVDEKIFVFVFVFV